MLRTERDREWIIGFVLGHGRNGYVRGIREVGFGAAVNIAKKLSYLADAIGTVVEEEKSVVIF